MENKAKDEDRVKALNRAITHVGPILEVLANGRKAHDSMGKRMGTGYLHIIQEMVEQHSTDPNDTKADRLEVDHTSGSGTSAEITKMGLVGVRQWSDTEGLRSFENK